MGFITLFIIREWIFHCMQNCSNQEAVSNKFETISNGLRFLITTSKALTFRGVLQVWCFMRLNLDRLCQIKFLALVYVNTL